ncbi:MAG: fibronectin type III domain-containing protein [Pyrinomonadaceae bacterium]
MLKRIKLNKNKAHIVIICFAVFINLNCGKRKPPLPPFERVNQRVEIEGIQKGDKITLTWTMPPRNATGGSVLKIARADIYRLTEPLNEPLTLSEEEFAASNTLIGSLPISENDFAKKRLSYVDTLDFTGQPARLRYAVRFVNESGQKASFSNYFLIEPTSKVAANPKNLSARLTEEALILRWGKPSANVDDSLPVNILGYNVYRAEEANEYALLNSTIVNDSEFLDKLFEFDINYKYFVRAVSLGSNSEPIESSNSNVIEILPRDNFAPSPPSAITIAAAPNNLSIFFAVNPEKDIAGYKIYRSINSSLPKSQWQLLTPKVIQTNTFQDRQIESGKTYYYYLTAVDKAGNISESSEVFSETSP